MISVVHHPPDKGGATVLKVENKSITVLPEEQIKNLTDARFLTYRRKFLTDILPEIDNTFNQIDPKVIRTSDYLRHAIKREYNKRRNDWSHDKWLEHIRKLNPGIEI